VSVKVWNVVRSAPSRVAILLISGYQALIRPFLLGGCKHFPTCSEYAKTAFQTHGLFRGASLTARRLLRCHPFAHGGFDPVPAASERTSSAPTEVSS
jgi:uncharacterized protein